MPERFAPVVLDGRLLDLLVCPVTKGMLRYEVLGSELISAGAGLAYPVRGGIPVLFASEARVLG